MITLDTREIRTKFPDRQFMLGQKVRVREEIPEEPFLTYHTNLRVIKIIDEDSYLVQDQEDGKVFLCHTRQMFLDEYVRNEYHMY